MIKVIEDAGQGRPRSSEAGPGPVRGIPQAQPERQLPIDHPGPARPHPRPDRRHHRLPSLPAARREAEPPRDDQQPGARPAAELPSRERDLPTVQANAPQGRQGRVGPPQVPVRPEAGRTSSRPGGASRARRRTTSPTRSRSSRRRSPTAKMPPDAEEKAAKEIERLETMPPMSAEATVCRNYLDWLISLPWNKKSREKTGPQGSRADPERGPLRAGEGQGADPRIPVHPPARQESQGRHPRPDRPAGRGQELAGQVHRPGDRPEVRPPVPRRRPRRGRDPGPPPDLHRRLSRPDHPDDQAGRDQESGLPPRRGRQDEHGFPRRSGLGAHGGPRPRAEQHLPRPLHRHRFRPVPGHVHRHGQHARAHPAAAHRPHGDHPPPRLHRGREAPDRQAVPVAEADEGPRPVREPTSRSRTPALRRSSTTTRAKPASATWSARSPRSAARSSRGSSRRRPRPRRR